MAGAVILALGFGLTACGAAGADDLLPSKGEPTQAAGASPDPSAAEQSFEDAMLAFARCLREHGVDVADPEPGGGIALQGDPANADLLEKAHEACQYIMEEARKAPGAPQMPPMDDETKEKMLQLARCMREKGYEFPDPEFDAEGGGMRVRIGGGAPGTGPQDHEQMQSDMTACQQDVGLEAMFGSGPRQRG